MREANLSDTGCEEEATMVFVWDQGSYPAVGLWVQEEQKFIAVKFPVMVHCVLFLVS